MDRKWVYRFEEGGEALRDLLGGKGAGLAEMTRAGIPVPPGFVITTEACNAYYEAGRQLPEGLWEQVLEAIPTGRFWCPYAPGPSSACPA
jgi:pyruvate,orthophosphate dikinase